MATIGTFTKTAKGFKGKITTLTLRADATIEPSGRSGDKAPDFKLVIAGAEVGAAWSKTAESGKAYLNIKLDDPSFAAPAWAQLHEMADGSHALIWDRK